MTTRSCFTAEGFHLSERMTWSCWSFWEDQGQPASSVQVPTVVGPSVTLGATSTQGVASISGRVQDPSKALIPGVKVTATNVDTGVESMAITNEAGLYAFPSMTRGRYTMTVSIPGFKTMTVSNLSIGDTQLLQDLTVETNLPVSANPSAGSCSQDGIAWCTLLHRAK